MESHNQQPRPQNGIIRAIQREDDEAHIRSVWCEEGARVCVHVRAAVLPHVSAATVSGPSVAEGEGRGAVYGAGEAAEVGSGEDKGAGDSVFAA